MERLGVDNRMFRVIRKVHRLTTRDMAKLLSISQTYVNRIEGNYEPVTENVERKLIDKFNLTNDRIKEITSDYDKYSKINLK